MAICSWLRFCSVMSLAIFDAPTILPSASLTGETVSETTAKLPSSATPNGLELFDPLSPPDTRENLTFSVVSVFRNNNRDRLANCLFGSVAEDALCASIPTYDNAIEIFAYDYVFARLYDRRYPTQSLFTFAQRVLDLLTLVDERLASVTSRLTSSTVSSLNNCIRLSTMTSRPSLQICRSSPDQ